MVSALSTLVTVSFASMRWSRNNCVGDVARRTLANLRKRPAVYQYEQGSFVQLSNLPKNVPTVVCKRGLVVTRAGNNEVCTELMLFFAKTGVQLLDRKEIPEPHASIPIYSGRRFVGTLGNHDILVRQAIVSGHYQIIATSDEVHIHVYAGYYEILDWLDYIYSGFNPKFQF